MIYKNAKNNKKEALNQKKENNYLTINECNKLIKNINIACSIAIGLSIFLISPALLYYIDIIPVTVPFYPLVMSALLGAFLGTVATIPTIIGNVGIVIIKTFLNISNKKITIELEQLNNAKNNVLNKETINKKNQSIKSKEQLPKNNNYNYQYNYTPNFILPNNNTNLKNTNPKRKILKK